MATLAQAGAPWLLPALGLGLFLHKHFLSAALSPLDARTKAAARCRRSSSRPLSKRSKATATSRSRQGNKQQHASPQHQQQQQHQHQTDSVGEQLDAAGLGRPDVLEWFTEDEVEALQQAQAHSNPQALLNMLQE